MEKLTIAMENYIETIYELSQENTGVRITDISKKMNISKASASNAMNTLYEKGYVTTLKYKLIYLTPLGLEYAKNTTAKHQAIKLFLIDALNLDEQLADHDACIIEHIISNKTIDKMKEYLKERNISLK